MSILITATGPTALRSFVFPDQNAKIFADVVPLVPATDSALDVGAAAFRWREVFAKTVSLFGATSGSLSLTSEATGQFCRLTGSGGGAGFSLVAGSPGSGVSRNFGFLTNYTAYGMLELFISNTSGGTPVGAAVIQNWTAAGSSIFGNAILAQPTLATAGTPNVIGPALVAQAQNWNGTASDVVQFQGNVVPVSSTLFRFTLASARGAAALNDNFYFFNNGQFQTGGPIIVGGDVILPGGNSLTWSGGAAISQPAAGVLQLTGKVNGPTQPRCSAWNNVQQSVPVSVATALALNTEDFDVGGMHDNTTNNSRVTVPAGGDGVYLMVASCLFAADAAGVRQINVQKNGSVLVQSATNVSPTAAGGTLLQAVAALTLVAGDYLEVVAVHTGSAAILTGSTVRSAANALSLVKLW